VYKPLITENLLRKGCYAFYTDYNACGKYHIPMTQKIQLMETWLRRTQPNNDSSRFPSFVHRFLPFLVTYFMLIELSFEIKKGTNDQEEYFLHNAD
jgi:hypothetical protein